MIVDWYYPIWRPSSPRRRPINSTTTSSKALAWTASPASSIRPISAPPRKSRRWSRIVPRQCLWRRRRSIWGCPGRCGSPLSKPAWSAYSSPSGRNPARVRLRRTICCWPRSIASAIRAPRPKWPAGMTAPSCVRCGIFLRSDLARKSSGTASTASRRNNWNKPRLAWSVRGSKSS